MAIQRLRADGLMLGVRCQLLPERFSAGTLAYVLSLVGGDAVYSDDERALLGMAAKLTSKDTKTAPGRKGWFKSITKMERVGAEVLGPYLAESDTKIKNIMRALFAHVHD